MSHLSLTAAWLGRVAYEPGFRLQSRLLELRKSDHIDDTLLLLEHDPVFTHGRRGTDSHILADRVRAASSNVPVVETDRGGETTYHGPGQLVVYPIISIRRLSIGPVAYVRLLEEVTLQLLKEHGIPGHRVVGKTGVWVGGEPGNKVAEGAAPLGRKIAAIGVRVSGGIAMHGTALNVAPNMLMFNDIVPCGMPGLDVTSMKLELGRAPSIEDAGWHWANMFADILGYEMTRSNAAEIWALRNEAAATFVSQ